MTQQSIFAAINKPPSQEDQVAQHLEEFGAIDNFWCIDTRLTTRLGAVIFKLRAKGWEIDTMRGKQLDKPEALWKNTYYILIKQPHTTNV